MHFVSRATRIGISEAAVRELRQRLFQAPPPVQAFFRPRLEEQEEYFDLTEGLLIARKG